MIEKILNYFGYFKPVKFTEEQLFEELAKITLQSDRLETDKESESFIFRDLSKVDKYIDYLKSVMSNDTIRYFGAADDKERALVRGMFARTAYLYKRIKEVREPQKVKAPTKLSSGRYGV